MKLIRFKESGKIKPGIVDKDNNIRDFSKIFSDWNSEMLTESLLLKIREYKIDLRRYKINQDRNNQYCLRSIQI